MNWPTGHNCQPYSTVSPVSQLEGSRHSRVLNSFWIIHECTPSPLTVTGKSQIKFFSSPEKDPINIPGVRQIHHLAFLTWAGEYLEATWNLPGYIRFPPIYCVLVSEIQWQEGVLFQIISWFWVILVKSQYLCYPCSCCTASPIANSWLSTLSQTHLLHWSPLKTLSMHCSMPGDGSSAFPIGLPPEICFLSRCGPSNLYLKTVRVATFANNQILKIN